MGSTDPKVTERSYSKLQDHDFKKLYEMAVTDRTNYFNRYPKQEAKRGELIGTFLVQGAAMHFVDGITGVNDFDVVTLYKDNGMGSLYAKRIGNSDFGDSTFGKRSDEKYVGRRIDFMFRTVKTDKEDPVEILQEYFEEGNGSAKLWAKKAAVCIDPGNHFGRVVWYQGKK